MPSQMPDLKGFTVLDTSGTAVPAATLWQSQTAVIGFVRHFG